MVSCNFCRKKVWYEPSFSSTFARKTFSTYRCTKCKLWLVIQKHTNPITKETIVKVNTEPFKDEVGAKRPSKLLLRSISR